MIYVKRKQKIHTMSPLIKTNIKDQQEKTNSFTFPKLQNEEIQKFQSNQMYKKHEKKLIWLSFSVAVIMLLSIIGKIVSG
jgi:hypothetical protein